MSKDVKGESKKLGREDYCFESWKKRKKEKKKALTPHSKVSSTNIRKQLLQHEEIRRETHYSAHVESLSSQET